MPLRGCFWAWAISALMALGFCAAAARGQALAPDQTHRTFGGSTPLDFVRDGLTPQTVETYSHDQTVGLLAKGDFRDSSAQLGSLPAKSAEQLAALASPPADEQPVAFTFAGAPAVNQSAPYQAITGRERLSWVVKGTLWPQHLAGGVITSAFGTGLDRPREDGPHWGGFAERFGVRVTGVAPSNLMEAGFGALWGEDPRYFRVSEDSFGERVKNVVKMTFLARRADGNFALAYARLLGVSGNNFLSNAWRPNSEANVHDAVLRTLEGFAGRMAANAWDEFWLDAKVHIFHRANPNP
jgi:hypothetical protein